MIPTALPDSWSDVQLDALRQQGDEPADQMMAQVFAEGGVPLLNRVLTHMLNNQESGASPATLPPVVAQFLAETRALPPWADQNKLKMGEGLFEDQGPLILLALTCASLPECYINGNESKVLGVSNRLKGGRAFRRIYETAQLIVDVLSPGGLTTPGGAGIIAAQRVRILHAGMRHLIAKAQPPKIESAEAPLLRQLAALDAPKPSDKPINQEDLAYTLGTFSYVVLRSLDILGVPLDAARRDAYVHCWGVVGYVLGIQESLIPRDYQQAQQLFERLKAHQARPTAEGRTLAKSLWIFMGKILRCPWIGRRTAILMMRTLLDVPTLQGLGIGRLNLLDRIVMRLLRWWVGGAEQLQQDILRTELRPAVQWLQQRLIEGLTTMPRSWEGRLFAVPSAAAAVGQALAEEMNQGAT